VGGLVWREGDCGVVLARWECFSCLGRCVEGGTERVEFMVMGREGDI
jgi:hypothetical protein